MKLPPAVPELPVRDVGVASESYARHMGFSVDWTYEGFLAGISRDDARIFLRRQDPGQSQGGDSVLVWLNMASAAEVDQLYDEWKRQGALIVEDPHTTPYNLRQFVAQDLDGNRFRVFHDLASGTS